MHGCMLFDWLTDPDFSLQQIRTAFSRAKSDIRTAFDWIRYLNRQHQNQQHQIEQLEKRVHELERELIL